MRKTVGEKLEEDEEDKWWRGGDKGKKMRRCRGQKSGGGKIMKTVGEMVEEKYW